MRDKPVLVDRGCTQTGTVSTIHGEFKIVRIWATQEFGFIRPGLQTPGLVHSFVREADCVAFVESL